jgi:hypothetical protein
VKQLNIRRLKVLVWLLTAAAAGASGLKFFELYENVQAGVYEPEAASTFVNIISMGGETGEVEIVKTPESEDYKVLWDCPINGHVKPKAVPKVEAEPEPEVTSAEPIETQLEVKTIIYSPDGAVSLVFLAYKDDAPHVSQSEVVLQEGSRLKYPFDEEPYNASIAAIHADGVEILWAGEVHRLRPKKLEDLPTPGALPNTKPNVVRGLTDKERHVVQKFAKEERSLRLGQLGPESYLIGVRDRRLFSSDAEAVLRDVRVREVDGPRGKEVMLSTVRRSYQQSYGVQNGDVLVSINGAPVTSKTQAINYVRQNPNQPKYDVVVRRQGKTISKTFYVPQD